MNYYYKIVNGELTCKISENGNAPEGWHSGEDKFSQDAKKKARLRVINKTAKSMGSGKFEPPRRRGRPRKTW